MKTEFHHHRIPQLWHDTTICSLVCSWNLVLGCQVWLLNHVRTQPQVQYSPHLLLPRWHRRPGPDPGQPTAEERWRSVQQQHWCDALLSGKYDKTIRLFLMTDGANLHTTRLGFWRSSVTWGRVLPTQRLSIQRSPSLRLSHRCNSLEEFILRDSLTRILSRLEGNRKIK